MAFADVPDLPGVPVIPRLPGAVGVVVDLLLADVLSLFAGLAEPPWGLFKDGVPVVTAESVVSFDFRKGASISNFPVEDGGFESYNKVQRPFDVRLRLATGGTLSDRQELLESVAAAVASLDLMDAVSPEAVYENVNPVHYDYRRTSVSGRGMLIVDVFCEEVRVRSSSSFTSSSAASGSAAGQATPAGSGSSSIIAPQSPGAAPVVNGGTVQSAPAAPGQFDLSQALP